MFAALTLALQPLEAQSVRGTVMDLATRRPLDNVIITILNARDVDIGKRPVRSDSLGRFLIHAGNVGEYRLRATRIGYTPVTSGNIALSIGGQVATVELNMNADATRLSTVLVTGTTRLSSYELMSHIGFELRKSKGVGKFLDTADLARFRRQPIAHTLEDAKIEFGIDIVRGSLKLTEGLRICSPEIWVDGFEPVPGFEMQRLESLGADQIYGVEIFKGSQMPASSIGAWIGTANSLPTVLSPNPNHGQPMVKSRTSMRPCGAILVWTKSFVREMQKKGDAKKPPPPHP